MAGKNAEEKRFKQFVKEVLKVKPLAKGQKKAVASRKARKTATAS